jgi:hypothetical protein
LFSGLISFGGVYPRWVYVELKFFRLSGQILDESRV